MVEISKKEAASFETASLAIIYVKVLVKFKKTMARLAPFTYIDNQRG